MSIQPFVLHTTDGKGEKHRFTVAVQQEPGSLFRLIDKSRTYTSYDFSVQTEPGQEDGEHFQLTLVHYDDGLLRIDTVDNHGREAFMRKGIMPALIDWIASHFNKAVESSSNDANEKRLRNESRNQAAELTWKKMVGHNLAIYDVDRDVYVYPAPVTPTP